MEPKIHKIIVHNIGNKSTNDGFFLSQSLINIDDKETLLNKYFLSSMKFGEYYNLYHEANIDLNEIFFYSKNIFADCETFHSNSISIAKHLYEKSEHPKIKAGDLFIIYFKNLQFENQSIDGLGIFKSENKDTFLKLTKYNSSILFDFDAGLNLNKIDKGCLIYNIEKENGFVVSIIDNTNKGGIEARYWKDDFLYVKHRRDEYHHTQNILTLCKNFITKELPQQFEVSKADQVDYLNKSVQFFKDRDNFDMQEFANEVIGQPAVIDSFNQFKEAYQQEQEINLSDQFTISAPAVKKQSRVFKSVIRLDKNFHIYVHGSRQLIEQGTDEKGKFYKVYYQEES